MTPKFKQIENESTYKRWTEPNRIYIVTWYKYRLDGGKYSTDPHFECYRKSVRFPGSDHLKTFEEAERACTLDSFRSHR